MKTVLLSTSACWNCGDDWIREGLLHALKLCDDVRILWWNRGWGIREEYQNSLAVNLPLVDHVIMAGTPEWIDKNEGVLRWCLRNKIPVAFLGIGRTGGYIPERHDALVQALAASGLVEISVPRDEIARSLLTKLGFEPTVAMSDPALFLPPLPTTDQDLSIVCWRGLGHVERRKSFVLPDTGNWRRMNDALLRAYCDLPDPKMVVVHENREVAAAEKLFGEQVYFSSDPAQLYRLYSRCRYFVGTRIHGWVASAVHGAPGYLLYPSPKAAVVETIINRLGWEESGVVEYVESGRFAPALDLKPPDVSRIDDEAEAFRTLCLSAPKLRGLMKP